MSSALSRQGEGPFPSVGRLLWARAKPWGLYAPLQGCLGHCGAAPQAGLRPPIAAAFRCDPPILARPTSSLSPCPCTSPVWSTPCSRPHVLRLHPTTLVRRVGWSSRLRQSVPASLAVQASVQVRPPYSQQLHQCIVYIYLSVRPPSSCRRWSNHSFPHH